MLCRSRSFHEYDSLVSQNVEIKKGLTKRTRRIEECIQRFRARRRLTNNQNNLFNRYLFLGGIDTSPRQFTGATGMDKDDIKNASSSEMRAMVADDVISRSSATSSRYYNPGFPEHWDVDFYGIVAGFL